MQPKRRDSSWAPRAEAPARSPSPHRSGAERLNDIPSPFLQRIVSRLVENSQTTDGDPLTADAAETLLALALAVCAHPHAPPTALDRRVASPLGRRLLDLVQSEIIQTWAEAGPEAVRIADVLPLLAGVEQVRRGITDHSPDPFAPLSGPDGLGLLVEVAHDLRSPLNSILFLAETLQRAESGEVNELQRRQLGLIYSAALGLTSLASDLIELARGGKELFNQDPTPFSVSAILESVRQIVRPMAEEKGITIQLLSPAHDARLGHSMALSRVLLNLTTNALKFTEAGTVELTAQPTGLTRIEFAVRDTGRGISAEALANLYRPFRHRGQRGYTFSGTSVGLAICRQLVEAMGSRLKVETRQGSGTRFHFELDLPLASCP